MPNSALQTHLNPVRVRVKGEGNLQAFAFDAGEIYSTELDPKAMSTATGQSVNYLCNFRGEKVCVQLMVSELDEYFVINAIYAFVKPIALSFPQV